MTAARKSMARSTHTPGPWEVADCGTKDCWCRRIVSKHSICEGDEADSNGFYSVVVPGALFKHDASLVAAAPELLAALEAILADEELIYIGGPHTSLEKAGMDRTDKLASMARAAIKKARGE